MIDYLLISSGGSRSSFLAVLLAETNAAFIACMHIRSLRGRSVSRVIHMQPGRHRPKDRREVVSSPLCC